MKETQEEGKKISKIIEGNLLVKDKASTNNVLNYKKPKILHFATHSVYESKNLDSYLTPLINSGIALAGANNKGNFLDVRKDDVSLPNGENSTREWINHPGAVVVVNLLTGENDVVLKDNFKAELNSNGKKYFEFIYDNVTDGYKMIGNAVPVNFAKILANQFIGILK